MATSPIYNWPEPDNTDLVKNGALAIRTLGNAIDTTMATMVPKTIVDAKGDLIAGTAADTTARLAVGNNGETLIADSSTATGLRYTAGTVQSNPVINSAMQIWQRGTSIALGAGTYTADRWYGYRGVAGSTVSRQVTNDTTNLPFIQYAARVQRDSGNTSTSAIAISTSLESINSIPFAGKTVTLSFYARAGANFSQASSVLTFTLSSGTGTDQNVMFGYTGQATVATTNATLTTTWQRFTVSGTVATTATELGIKIGDFTPVGTAGANDWFEVTGVQIDIGSVALPFRTYAGSIQQELAACQRYYNRITPSTGAYEVLGSGYAISTTVTTITVPFPVSMRVKPTAVETTGTASNYAVLNGSGGVVACSVVPAIDSQNTNLTGLLSATVASGLTAGQGTQLRANNTTAAYIGWSAEL